MFAAPQASPSATPADPALLVAPRVYTGTGAAQTVTTNINLLTGRGLVWIKNRSTGDHALFSTASGATKYLSSNLTSALTTNANSLTAFSATGFSVGTAAIVNTLSNNYISWTLQAFPRFSDVVAYTGTGGVRSIPHSLGAEPGMIIVKRTDNTGDWYVYHRSVAADPETDYLLLNSTATAVDDATIWNDTAPTAAVFTLGTGAANTNGASYVAYLFAHDATSDSIIKCGSFATTGVPDNGVATLGWEPQFVLVRNISTTDSWHMLDTLRGLPFALADGNALVADTNAGEIARGFSILPNGFRANNTPSGAGTYIYVAIRRGPITPPSIASQVFAAAARTGTGSAGSSTALGQITDLAITKRRNGTETWAWTDRVRRATYEVTSASNAAEAAYANDVTSFVSNTGFAFGTGASGQINTSAATYVDYLFRRCAGFFDQSVYIGVGGAASFPHNLRATPELMIVKSLSAAKDWTVYAAVDTVVDDETLDLDFVSQAYQVAVPAGTDKALVLNSTAGLVASSAWNDTVPTNSSFTVNGTTINNVGETCVAYLAASVPGVSKIGQYTGNGSTKAIDCDFRTGARFILIKRLDDVGPWYIWDSVRGISSDTDPYVLINSTAAEVTTNDSVDNYSGGFYVYQNATTNINVLNGTYLFWAIA